MISSVKMNKPSFKGNQKTSIQKSTIASKPLTVAQHSHKLASVPANMALSQMPNVKFKGAVSFKGYSDYRSYDEISLSSKLDSAISNKDHSSAHKLNIEMAQLLENKGQYDDASLCYDGALKSLRQMNISPSELAEKETELYQPLANVLEKRGDAGTTKHLSYDIYSLSTPQIKDFHYNNAEMCHNEVLKALQNKTKTKDVESKMALTYENIGRICYKRGKLIDEMPLDRTNLRKQGKLFQSAEMCYNSAIDLLSKLNPSDKKISTLFHKVADILEANDSPEAAKACRESAKEILEGTSKGLAIVAKRAKGIW